MTFEEWWENKSGWGKSSPLLVQGTLAKAAWDAALDEAQHILSDAGSQHFDHDDKAYVDSWELVAKIKKR